MLSQRWTDQPQRWAFVPAAFMAIAGAVVLALAPTGNELGWVWPPVVFALAVWMIVRARRDLHSRTRVWIVYPVCVALALSCIGGAYETYRESTDHFPMAGRLIDVGGHKLHIDCTGTGSPTVVLEPGLGEPSTAMAWIAPDVATTTRVCVYDRAGRGWSESAGRPQDGVEVATDLHTLLDASRRARTVRARRSLRRRHLRPQLRAPLPRRRSRESSCSTRCTRSSTRRSPGGPRSTRCSVGRRQCSRRCPASVSGAPCTDPPTATCPLALATSSARSGQRLATAAASATSSPQIRTAMAEAQSLTTLGDRPLVVLTAEKDAEGGWMAAQNELAALSTNSVHQLLPNASHSMLTEDKDTAARSSRAINEVVNAVRTKTAVTGQAA